MTRGMAALVKIQEPFCKAGRPITGKGLPPTEKMKRKIGERDTLKLTDLILSSDTDSENEPLYCRPK